MPWYRTLLLRSLAPLLFLALLVTAYATSANLAFAKPDKLEGWLTQSSVYDHVVSYAIDRTKQTTDNPQVASIPTNDPAVQQAAKQAFTSDTLKSAVNKFLDGNYAWLQGKTDKPNFSIDLSQAKQSFAQQLGKYEGDRYESLPVCTAADLAQLENTQNTNLLSLSCRVPGLSAQAASAAVTQAVQNNSGLLNDTTVTPENLSQEQGSQSDKPYYQRLPSAPSAYKIGRILPWLAAVVALLSAIGLILLAPRRRRGVKRVAVTLLLSGLILIIGKFFLNIVFSTVQSKVAGSSTSAQLQQAIIYVLRRAEDQLTRVDFWFGIVFIGVAIVIALVLRLKRGPPAHTAEWPAAPPPIA